MRIALGVVLLVHAAIHVLGFVAALGQGRSESLRRPTSVTLSLPAYRILAAVWLAAVVSFAAGAVGLFSDATWWRTPGFLGVLTSTVAIALWWRDAKYGVPLTALVLVAVLAAPSVDALP